MLGALAATGPAGGQGESPAPEDPAWQILDQRPAEGQQCIVCRVRVHEGNIVEVRYKGRTFFVSATMLAEFEARPDTYFHALQAHGGLFDEAALETPPMRTGWLVFGLYVFTGLIAGAGCAYLALNRGLPAWGWFFAGLLANAPAVAAVLTRKRRLDPLDQPVPAGLAKIPTTAAPVNCRHCGAGNHPAAPACSACGHPLSPTVEPETARA